MFGNPNPTMECNSFELHKEFKLRIHVVLSITLLFIMDLFI